ncbi:metallophosphoesterase [Bacteriovorax sp. Seq25_V]|uniref:metallophosphoesterase n=1 Tax=Bacteriovorax sp. Seq25_V TaxID=1201288 RepID=UPI00038A4E4C|nr:metallophosphoesterase [Bacteriovorax sp. Seq25_V]EQC47099.1 Ser/Thr phosphatase family protein [Bacteriovorax sp. Seq25_V]
MEKSKNILVISTLFALSSCNLFHDYSKVEDEVYLENLFDSKVCIIGDTGTGSSDQHLVAKEMSKENCKNIIHTGDLIYPDGLKSTDDPKFKLNFLDPFAESMTTSRFFLTLGNHDYRRDPKPYLDLAKTNESIVFPNYYYLARFQDACLLFIDTNLNYRGSQEKWLRNKVNELINCSSSFIIGHHPLVSSGDHGNATGLIKSFLEKYVKDHTPLYISGHDHQLSYEKIDEHTFQLISGAGAKLRPVKKLPTTLFVKSDLGYVVLEKVNGKINIIFKVINFNKESEEAFRTILD